MPTLEITEPYTNKTIEIPYDASSPPGPDAIQAIMTEASRQLRLPVDKPQAAAPANAPAAPGANAAAAPGGVAPMPVKRLAVPGLPATIPANLPVVKYDQMTADISSKPYVMLAPGGAIAYRTRPGDSSEPGVMKFYDPQGRSIDRKTYNAIVSAGNEGLSGTHGRTYGFTATPHYQPPDAAPEDGHFHSFKAQLPLGSGLPMTTGPDGKPQLYMNDLQRELDILAVANPLDSNNQTMPNWNTGRFNPFSRPAYDYAAQVMSTWPDKMAQYVKPLTDSMQILSPDEQAKMKATVHKLLPASSTRGAVDKLIENPLGLPIESVAHAAGAIPGFVVRSAIPVGEAALGAGRVIGANLGRADAKDATVQEGMTHLTQAAHDVYDLFGGDEGAVAKLAQAGYYATHGQPGQAFGLVGDTLDKAIAQPIEDPAAAAMNLGMFLHFMPLSAVRASLHEANARVWRGRMMDDVQNGRLDDAADAALMARYDEAKLKGMTTPKPTSPQARYINKAADRAQARADAADAALKEALLKSRALPDPYQNAGLLTGPVGEVDPFQTGSLGADLGQPAEPLGGKYLEDLRKRMAGHEADTLAPRGPMGDVGGGAEPLPGDEAARLRAILGSEPTPEPTQARMRDVEVDHPDVDHVVTLMRQRLAEGVPETDTQARMGAVEFDNTPPSAEGAPRPAEQAPIDEGTQKGARKPRGKKSEAAPPAAAVTGPDLGDAPTRPDLPAGEPVRPVLADDGSVRASQPESTTEPASAPTPSEGGNTAGSDMAARHQAQIEALPKDAVGRHPELLDNLLSNQAAERNGNPPRENAPEEAAPRSVSEAAAPSSAPETAARETAPEHAVQTEAQQPRAWEGVARPQKEAPQTPRQDLSHLVEAAVSHLESAPKRNPARVAKILSEFEQQGIDVSDVKDALDEYKDTRRSDFDSNDDYQEAREQAWSDMIDRLGEVDATDVSPEDAPGARDITPGERGASASLRDILFGPDGLIRDETGATINFVDLLRDERVKRGARRVHQQLEDIRRSVRYLLSPTLDVPEGGLAAMHHMLGQINKQMYRLELQGQEMKRAFAKMKDDDLLDFWQRYERGEGQRTPELDGYAVFMHTVYDEMYRNVVALHPDLNYIVNYAAHFWDVRPKQLEDEAEGLRLGRRPLQGQKAFVKKRSVPGIWEGVQDGGVPVSLNPQVVLEMAYRENLKYVQANELMATLKGAGLAEFLRAGEELERTPHAAVAGGPEVRFVKIKDPIAQVYYRTTRMTLDAGPDTIHIMSDKLRGPLSRDLQGEAALSLTRKDVPGPMVRAGEWVVEENVARLIDNFLGEDWFRHNKITGDLGRSLLGIKNMVTAWRLGFSLFHAMYVTSESYGSQAGLNLRMAANPGNAAGLPANIARFAMTPIDAAKLGKNIQEYIADPDTFVTTAHGMDFIRQYPDAARLVDLLFDSGAKVGMHEDYRIDGIHRYLEARANGSPFEAAWRAIPAGMEVLQGPLFQTYIPRLKLATYFKEMSQSLVEQHDRLMRGEVTEQQIGRKVWRSVENRFGEMNFDNFFWDRGFKSALQFLFRSITWKVGNLSEGWAALAGQAEELGQGRKLGRRPILNQSTAWLVGMALMTAAQSAVIQKTQAGTFPSTLKDVVFPQINPDDPTERIAVPSMMKDYFHLAYAYQKSFSKESRQIPFVPSDYIQSSVSDDLTGALEWYNNRDFFGNQVYNPDDTYLRNLWDGLNHMVSIVPGSTGAPISWQQAAKAYADGDSLIMTAAKGLGAVSSAPKYVTRDPLEEYLYDKGQENPTPTRTTQEAQDARKINQVVKQLQKEPRDQQKTTVRGMLTTGDLAPADVEKIVKKLTATPHSAAFKKLDLASALRAYELADTAERQELRPEMLTKVSNNLSDMSDQDRARLVALGLTRKGK